MAYVKCATETCMVKISESVVVAWDGKCPKCRGVQPNYGPTRKATESRMPKGYVKCVSSSCRTQISEIWIAQNPDHAMCNLCKGVSYVAAK